ncbi:MAG: Ig-like domain-containing protein, partial [Bacteroides sp.]|nr:Ig-like domain-containing protein [Bacteroides sp.]
LFTSRKEDYATDSIPDFERILSLESTSYGMVENTVAILDGNRCIVSSEIKIGGASNGNDFTVAYAILENQVGPLSYMTMDYTRKESILDGYARGIYPGTYGEICLPEKIEKDVSYSVSQSFEVPNSIQDRNNLEIVTLLINCNGEIVNAEKVIPIEKSNSILIESIEIVEDMVEMNIGETRQLKVCILPENATDKRILWSSDNELIASVDNNGFVTLKNQGTVNIYARSMDGSLVEDVCMIHGSAGIHEILTEDMPIDIYDLNGMCLKHNTNTSFINKLKKGCYLIKSQDKVYKVVR